MTYGPTPNYIKGGITFAPNSTVKAATAGRDGEPSSRIDVFGNYYIGGIRGVPAGVDLWYFDLRPNSDPGSAEAKNPYRLTVRGENGNVRVVSVISIGPGADPGDTDRSKARKNKSVLRNKAIRLSI